MYNTGSSLFIIPSSQTSVLTKSVFICVPTHNTGRSLPGRQTAASFKKEEVFNVRGCINHVGSLKRSLQAVAEVLPAKAIARAGPNHLLTVR